jgi:hypothetical protein
MSKHTPGPWLTTESTEHWGRVNVTVQAAFTANEIATAWQGTTDVNRANARLIAAAPDLLEVLKAFSDYVRDEQMATDGAVTYPTTAINHWAFLARAAIAKATGGEQ